MRSLVALLLVAGLIIVGVRIAPSEEFCFRSGLRVSDEIPPEEVPEVVAAMSAREFANWARSHNEGQLAAARKRYEAYLAERGPLKKANVVESRNLQQGGYGYGGLGGFGSGFGGLGGLSSVLGGFGSGMGGLGSGFGGLGGFGSGLGGFGGGQGNSFQTRSYEITFPDMNDTGGGSVTLINPYCHAYWATQTGARAY